MLLGPVSIAVFQELGGGQKLVSPESNYSGMIFCVKKYLHPLILKYLINGHPIREVRQA